MRVVSLLPSATDILYELGVEPVAVSHECDVPDDANPAVVVHSRVDPDGSSTDIDAEVQEAERESGGVYELDAERLAAVDPELVVTQGVCEVCAVDGALVERTVADLDLDAEILTTHPHTLDDVFEDIERIGDAVEREGAAADLVAGLRDRVAAVEDRTATVDERPRTAVLDWLDPVMVGGHWVGGLVASAGGEYGLADPGEPSRPHEFGDIREYDPEVLILAPCGFDVAQTRENIADATDRDGWDDLTAVRDGRVYVHDGHHHVNRPGPALVDTLESFAALLHPDLFDAPPAEVAVRLDE